MSESPWWHPTDDDDWDEPLPPVVTLEPDYHAKLPLGGEGELPWQRTKFTPELLDRLAAWQEEFETNFHVQGAGVHRMRRSDGPLKPKILLSRCARSWVIEPNFS